VLQSPDLPQWALKITVPAVGAMLALAAALAAACFVKLYGVAFLGRPRSLAAETAGEVDRYSLAAMFILAALCLLDPESDDGLVTWNVFDPELAPGKPFPVWRVVAAPSASR